MNYENLLLVANEATDKINTGEKLEGIHYLVVMAGLACLGHRICKQEGWPGAGMSYHNAYQNLLVNSEGPLQEWEARQEAKQTYHVFYRADDNRYEFDNDLTIQDVLGDKFVYIKDITVSNLSDLFFQMQGENWDFGGDEQEQAVRSCGHMSMSVGDVVRDEDGRFWQVNDVGWDKVKPKRNIPFNGEPVAIDDTFGNGLTAGVDF